MSLIKSMVAVAAIACFATFLVSCSPPAPSREELKTRETDTYVFTDELEGCKAFRVQNKWANNRIIVVRCPHSSTTTLDGKESTTVDSQ